MPSTYAHYRFGAEVYARLPGLYRRQIDANRELYDIGLHGPDILFYNKPFAPFMQPCKTGMEMHHQPGWVFFGRAARVLDAQTKPGDAQAFVYGFLCHFALDSLCHPYVNRAVQTTGVTHNEIEVEFDRLLLWGDGLPPQTHPLTAHIHPSEKNAEVIQAFLPGISSRQVQGALKGMCRYLGILRAPRPPKRTLLCAGMALTGPGYPSMRGLMMNNHPNPICWVTSRRLKTLYDRAVERAVDMIVHYWDFFGEDGQPDARFDLDFEGKRHTALQSKKEVVG